jgi:hypothetical protein
MIGRERERVRKAASREEEEEEKGRQKKRRGERGEVFPPPTLCSGERGGGVQKNGTVETGDGSETRRRRDKEGATSRCFMDDAGRCPRGY